jgi:tRNA1(Val) A37 N6-methylase TrmN6
MSEDCLRPGERLDDLVINNLKIIQHPDEFRFALDAVLLAHFATVKTGIEAVDLGTGTGVIALLLAARGAGKVIGLEISPTLADMAQRSVALNGLGDRITIINGDLRGLAGTLPPGRYPLVVANPPYRPLGQGQISPNDRVAQACHELTANLADVLAAASSLLQFRGRFAMVHLPQRLTDILAGMRAVGVEPKRLRLVQSYAGKPPKLLLVEGIRGGQPGLTVLPPLIIYDECGKYCREILAYYQPKPRE